MSHFHSERSMETWPPHEFEFVFGNMFLEQNMPDRLHEFKMFVLLN